MDRELFEQFRKIIYDNSGIALSPEKHSLLSSRIQKILRERRLTSESQYFEIIELDATGEELRGLIDAVSTNTTYFWREYEHFLTFAEILKGWKKEKKTKARIWCAASSTGQEPYTMAMEVMDNYSPREFDVKILATDVNTHVLRVAKTGFYSYEEISKLPAERRARFFVKDPSGLSTDMQVVPALAELISFRRFNLVEYPYKLKGPIDVVFCRNVMIYFDLATRQKIVTELSRLIPPGGYLFLSLAESLIGIQHPFNKIASSIYQRGD